MGDDYDTTDLHLDALSELHERIRALEAERDAYATEALAALAGAGIPTPEKGYVADGGPGLLAHDIKTLARQRDAWRNTKHDIDEMRAAEFGRYHDTRKQWEAERDVMQALVARYRKALEDIAGETGTPYSDTAIAALAGGPSAG